MSFRFHVHRDKPAYRLVIAEGAPFPAEANEDDWRFTLARERADTAPDVAKRVDETGYCLFKIGLSFDEIV
ncbi:hypothetical protein [Caulobacter sp. RL271]|uniref:Uncharacterized protein n=1 Tax=Caulobacter segnis TaxID=88688 RepID=A0ABY4ZWD0_9CAUL|nr:hypothetical protein [Caulobacter segnis]USQ97132.1 hypothetical protein MZV50_06150 [Caulobacter segnis]